VLTIFRAVSVLLVASCWAVGAEPKLLPQKLLDEGWISLFDGETLFGWQPTGDAKWEVADGEVRTKGEKSGFLMTTTEWADYELHAEFKAGGKTNSGVFLRTPLKPTDPKTDCYELNIAPEDNPFPTGSLVGRKKEQGYLAVNRAQLSSRLRLKPLAVWDNEWHAFNVSADGSRFSVKIDDRLVLEYDDPSPRHIGHIGLQSREGAVAFRNLRLKPLGVKSLFNGKDLEGWNKERAEKCTFDVTKDGELHLTNGPGQIETDQDFANFLLQLECKVNGDGLNSGIFFRTLRNGRWAGYESQINNLVIKGDRTKPKDFGTGAIYRRQPARRVVPNDHKWFTKTIVADGPHFAVWVNGYQVSDWTDKRPQKESGREGLRLGGGAIAIQGHDPTTDFLFRRIRVAELPAERSEVGGQRSGN
jgi:3-keto-disaccharide hydrolase